MKINKDQLISEFKLTAYGAQGWMSSQNLKCPECDKSGKFGIKFSDEFGAVHCFKCDYSESLFKYLKRIDRKEFIEFEKHFSVQSKLIEPVFSSITEEKPELIEVELPKGFERINFDLYLKDRNFKSHQYEEFQVGITNHFLEKKLHNYLIFQIFQENKRVGWIARSKFSKEFHEQNLDNFKENKERLILRYRNSENTNFDQILGGYDEITENTHTLIVVEGLLDYTNLSNLLHANESEELKVVFTFGNKLSFSQIELLRKTNVNRIILMFDANTVKQSKKYSAELSRGFDVDVCFIEDPKVDPGNINKKYLFEILNNCQNFYYFYNSKLKNFKLQ